MSATGLEVIDRITARTAFQFERHELQLQPMAAADPLARNTPGR